MKTILFPTDFSPAAENAFQYALNLADKLNANILTMHVYQDQILGSPYLPTDLVGYFEQLELSAFKNYQDEIGPLREMAESWNLGHISMRHVLRHDIDPVNGIKQEANTSEVDMIVMGTTGATGLKKVFLGSIAGELLEHAPCPVLAIPVNASFKELKRFGFGVGFEKGELEALHKLKTIVDPLQGEILAIHVDISNTHFYTNRMDRFKAVVGDLPNVSFTVNDEHFIKNGLLAEAKKNDLDAMALLTHKRNIFTELFNYSQAKNLAYHMSMPVLGLPMQAL